jgi:hypothetical protein
MGTTVDSPVPAPQVQAAEQLVSYRHLITLPDGMRVLLRPLASRDRDALVALFSSLPPQQG